MAREMAQQSRVSYKQISTTEGPSSRFECLRERRAFQIQRCHNKKRPCSRLNFTPPFDTLSESLCLAKGRDAHITMNTRCPMTVDRVHVLLTSLPVVRGPLSSHKSDAPFLPRCRIIDLPASMVLRLSNAYVFLSVQKMASRIAIVNF